MRTPVASCRRYEQLLGLCAVQPPPGYTADAHLHVEPFDLDTPIEHPGAADEPSELGMSPPAEAGSTIRVASEMVASVHFGEVYVSVLLWPRRCGVNPSDGARLDSDESSGNESEQHRLTDALTGVTGRPSLNEAQPSDRSALDSRALLLGIRVCAALLANGLQGRDGSPVLHL